jgi:hypothetical protein
MVTRSAPLFTLLWVTVLGLPRAHAAPPDPMGIPDAPTAVPGSLVPSDGLGVRLLSHSGEWTSFFSMSSDSHPILRIHGRLENTAGKPLTYVKLQYELLGENDLVVFRDYGYNRKAEVLREEDYESGKKALKDMEVEQVRAGAQDDFRFIFFKTDVPDFRAYRIRVLETR